MKYFILNVAITNFLLVIIYFLFQPATLFPLVGGFCLGILGIFGTEGTYLSLEITCVIILNQIVSFSCLMWYQYAIMKGRGKLVEFIKNPKLFIGSYIAYMFIAVATTITFMRLARSEKETIFMDFGQNEPDLLGFIQTVFIRQPSTIGYSMKSNIWLRLCTFFLLFFIFCEIMGIIVFNVMTIKTIHSTVDIVTKKTLEMQIMFYKSTLIESIFVICFILSPFIFAALIMFSVINNMHLGIIFFNISPLSAPINYILVMILLKPYRMFFVTIFKKIKSGRIKDSSSAEQKIQIIVHKNSAY
uniref:Uncharacterized protein n=1 Tax=Acrobeloides nanus TaxID=290746 RepID=A0A914DUC6_9BILA